MFRAFLASLVLFSPLSVANSFDEFYSSSNWSLGAEINPLGIIASSDSIVYLSGGVSIFNDSDSSEIHFPIAYKNIQRKGEQYTALNVGAHYRKFIEQGTDGYYFSAGAQVAHLNSDVTKLGIGFGAGYRKVFSSGMYWGYGVMVGRYFNDNEKYQGSALSSFETIEDESYLLDVEFLKIGMTF
jgi:hypothetical protein